MIKVAVNTRPGGMVCLVLAWGAASPALAEETIYWDVIAQIREEGFQRSQVMDLAGYMTDVLGPRLTGSRRMKKAQQWAKARMEEMGLVRVEIDPFGEHGVSWDNEYTSLHMIEPDYQPLIGYPYAFTPGTNGKIERPAAIAVIRARADFDRFRGKLRDRVVLASPARAVPPRFEADAVRLSAENLTQLEQATIASRFGVDSKTTNGTPRSCRS